MSNLAQDTEGTNGTVQQSEPSETPPSGAAAKIELRGIRKSFDTKKRRVDALGGVDCEVAEKEFVAIIGPSGCGKTTLLRIIASLIPPDDGEVLIDGTPVTQPGPKRATVFQQFGLFPWKTVLENVTFPLNIRKMSKQEANDRARRELARVGLDTFEDSYPHQLSGGMQQRVGLARALATEAEILLMDEPFGAIDAQTRELMQEELLHIWADTQKTIVFVTHDLDEAVMLADRIVVLSAGPASTVQQVVPVGLPRPRWEYDVRAEPEFARVRGEIWSLLKAGIERPPGQDAGE
ncbi:MAG TPA: ABC transporter ATP-binding protein [Nocardioidaceae bacterium]|nr:ABC transporter ATP-binding protein [Nocardioidaceae bacterium]